MVNKRIARPTTYFINDNKDLALVFKNQSIMLTLHSSLKFELYLFSTDMRKSFDSLCGIIQGDLKTKPTSGTVHPFVNKLHNRIKILHWRIGGFVCKANNINPLEWLIDVLHRIPD